MKKIINQANRFVDETIEGIALAYPDQVRVSKKSGRILLCVKRGQQRKVGIATCGGSGHLPTFLGYVGSGMLDGCAIGNVFASPSAGVIADTIREVDRGAGVLCRDAAEV
jgi:dihydroxyacetone kinase-like protein